NLAVEACSLREAGPLPVLRPRYKTRLQWIALDVFADCQKVPVGIDDVRFETALIDGSATRAPTRPMPMFAVSCGEPLHELRDLALVGWLHHKMKVCGHQAVRE